MIRDRPQVVLGYADDRKLKDERVRRNFVWRSRRLGRRRENLHPRTYSAPRPHHTVAAEAPFATNLRRSNEDRALNFVGDPLPFGCVERRTWLDRNDLFISIGERDTALCGR
jgi:hypothetical protein